MRKSKIMADLENTEKIAEIDNAIQDVKDFQEKTDQYQTPEIRKIPFFNRAPHVIKRLEEVKAHLQVPKKKRPSEIAQDEEE